MTDKLTEYIKSQSRNKIILHRDKIPGIVPIKISLILSDAIFNFNETVKLPMRVSTELDFILNNSITEHDVYGRYIAIANLGILFEPELKLDFSRLLDNYSQNNLLFVNWEGEIDTNNIYFLTKENGIKLNINNLSHIVI